MSIIHPLAFLLLLPALGVLAWLKFWRGEAALRLPGAWRQIVQKAMQSFMAERVVSQSRLPIWFWLAIWTFLVLALARPILDLGKPVPYSNLAGRVIAIDLGAGLNVDRQRLMVDRLLDAAPTMPTALVIATAEAFDVVPFTTDRAHFDRYLKVINPEIMPVSGRALGIAIVHAETMLERADIAVGQLILLTGGTVPPTEATKAGGWLRALVVDPTDLSAWTEYAARIGARLTDDTAIQNVINDLDGRVADAARDSDRASDFALAPWLLALAALLWLLFFRRVRSP
ncbi:MAG: hypothetical protein ACR2QF_07770 [Geminicoccaceae bacterium]